MTVLVTRPAQDCEKTIARLAERGIDAIAAPALEVRFRDTPIRPDGYRALIVTSTNAVRALVRVAEPSAFPGIPLYAVGDRTATAACEAGFADVRSASGAVDDLTALVRKEIDAGKGVLLHLSGEVVAGDLSAALGAEGYAVDRRIVYETNCADSLPDAARTALMLGNAAATLLYSPRSAACFAGLIERSGLGEYLTPVTAVTLSEAVAAKARGSGFGHTIVAERPDESALIDALERFLNDRRSI